MKKEIRDPYAWLDKKIDRLPEWAGGNAGTVRYPKGRNLMLDQRGGLVFPARVGMCGHDKYVRDAPGIRATEDFPEGVNLFHNSPSDGKNWSGNFLGWFECLNIEGHGRAAGPKVGGAQNWGVSFCRFDDCKGAALTVPAGSTAGVFQQNDFRTGEVAYKFEQRTHAMTVLGGSVNVFAVGIHATNLYGATFLSCKFEHCQTPFMLQTCAGVTATGQDFQRTGEIVADLTGSYGCTIEGVIYKSDVDEPMWRNKDGHKVPLCSPGGTPISWEENSWKARGAHKAFKISV